MPSGLERLAKAGNLDNLRIAAGAMAGTPQGPVFVDSDVYTWLEAVAREYARTAGAAGSTAPAARPT